MAFCANCGTQMGDGVKFRPSCGTQAGGAAPARPEKEKVGNIRKCPACGAEVPAMTAVCAECGHEFSNVSVGGDIKQFFEKVVELEKEDGTAGSGLGASYALTSYFQGYPVPSTKEDILEFFMFCLTRAKLKINNKFDGLLFGSFVNPFSYKPEFNWNYTTDRGVLWARKARQVYDKACISLSSDPAVVEKIADMLRDRGIPPNKKEEEEMLKKRKAELMAGPLKKMIFGAVVIVVVVVIGCIFLSSL
jgi:DNA-directed RNA polymerase subunit RPC12/RpoP